MTPWLFLVSASALANEVPAPQDEPAAWVLPGGPTSLVRRLERKTAPSQVVSIGDVTCFAFASAAPAPPPRLVKRLGFTPESRLSCDLAPFPVGRGWVVYTLLPASDLDLRLSDALVDWPLPAHSVRRTTDLTGLATLCVAAAAVGAHPLALREHLERTGLDVLGVYEVGSCSRD